MIRKYKKCAVKSCRSAVFAKKVCKYHYYLNLAKKVKNKPKKKISPISKKRSTDLNEYKKVRAEHFREHPCCQVRASGCLGCEKRALELHHTRGRIGDLLFDKRYFLTVCVHCHDRIHRDDTWAREHGYLLSRLNKIEEDDLDTQK